MTTMTGMTRITVITEMAGITRITEISGMTEMQQMKYKGTIMQMWGAFVSVKQFAKQDSSLSV